jgi:hypothetical protein
MSAANLLRFGTVAVREKPRRRMSGGHMLASVLATMLLAMSAACMFEMFLGV